MLPEVPYSVYGVQHMNGHNMDTALDRIVESFYRYYDVNLVDPAFPFHVEAVYRGKDMQYMLIERAKVFETENYEYVYFYKTANLTKELFDKLDKAAWEDGMNRVTPHSNHRSSDVTLVIVAESMDPECEAIVKKAKHHISYNFGFQGYSAFRLVVCDLSRGNILSNRRGSDLKKTVSNILSAT